MSTAKAAILVLEPDEGIEHLLDAILRRDGFAPVFVADGREAVEAFQHAAIAAFVVDVNLAPSALEQGAHRGVGFLRYLQREHPALLRHVVIISGVAPRELTAEIPPACRLLLKPFDIEELRVAVSECAA